MISSPLISSSSYFRLGRELLGFGIFSGDNRVITGTSGSRMDIELLYFPPATWRGI